MAGTDNPTFGEIVKEAEEEATRLIEKDIEGELSTEEYIRLEKVNALLEVIKEIMTATIERRCSRPEAWYLSERLNELYASFKQGS